MNPSKPRWTPKLPVFQTEGRCTTLLTLSQSCSRVMDIQENDLDLAAVFDGSPLRSLSVLSLRNKIHWVDTSKTMCTGNSCGASGSYLLVKIKSWAGGWGMPWDLICNLGLGTVQWQQTTAPGIWGCIATADALGHADIYHLLFGLEEDFIPWFKQGWCLKMPSPLATQGKCQKPRHTLSALSPEGQGATTVYQQLAHETLLILALGEGVSSPHVYKRDNQKRRVIWRFASSFIHFVFWIKTVHKMQTHYRL